MSGKLSIEVLNVIEIKKRHKKIESILFLLSVVFTIPSYKLCVVLQRVTILKDASATGVHKTHFPSILGEAYTE